MNNWLSFVYGCHRYAMFLTRTCTPLVTADVKCLTDIGFQQTSEFCDGNRKNYRKDWWCMYYKIIKTEV